MVVTKAGRSYLDLPAPSSGLDADADRRTTLDTGGRQAIECLCRTLPVLRCGAGLPIVLALVPANIKPHTEDRTSL
jgi:hypothetical protein